MIQYVKYLLDKLEFGSPRLNTAVQACNPSNEHLRKVDLESLLASKPSCRKGELGVHGETLAPGNTLENCKGTHQVSSDFELHVHVPRHPPQGPNTTGFRPLQGRNLHQFPKPPKAEVPRPETSKAHSGQLLCAHGRDWLSLLPPSDSSLSSCWDNTKGL